MNDTLTSFPRRRAVTAPLVEVDHFRTNTRRRQRQFSKELEALDLNGPHWTTPETFDDGPALFEAVCAHALEGVVAKRRASLYRPGECGWVKIKNCDYWRYALERETALHLSGRRRQFA